SRQVAGRPRFLQSRENFAYGSDRLRDPLRPTPTSRALFPIPGTRPPPRPSAHHVRPVRYSTSWSAAPGCTPENGAMAAEEVLVRVGGRTLGLSNLDKVLYPAVGYTKAEVISYYTQIAPVLLPYVRDRALTRLRYPNGVPID